MLCRNLLICFSSVFLLIEADHDLGGGIQNFPGKSKENMNSISSDQPKDPFYSNGGNEDENNRSSEVDTDEYPSRYEVNEATQPDSSEEPKGGQNSSIEDLGDEHSSSDDKGRR
ncbi:hypothetical protein AOXY_G3114 [Acipenser oxyrinchus oxyrinchus]|uniref:Uncharacterized protein n=1 Tax=Acipenser oxyrinchus oxyrinchus TaxID=40147 RepID=A0AAD8GF95_ACIOX|nr:hypothetical protein AOXY_G3114 [Acipenser oxyrinchus oxyrinchus]